MRLASVALLVFVSFLAAPFATEAQGRYCERRDALCWDCADIVFPAAIPCAEPDACALGQLCVDQEDAPSCLPPARLCCDSAPCELPPGCEGAGSSCSDTEGDGRVDFCTFLNPCPELPDGGAIDAGPMDAGSTDGGALDAAALDAGALDAGALDAGALDAGALDASTPDGGPLDASQDSAVDAAQDADAGFDRGVAVGPSDGGCGCSVSLAPTPTPLFALLIFIVFRRRF